MKAKRRHRKHHALLGRDPARRILIWITCTCLAFSIYFAWQGYLASKYLAVSAPHPDDMASTGFFMAALVTFGVSLVHTVDQPAGLHRLRNSRRWRRFMRR